MWFKILFHLFGSSMKGKATLQLSKLPFFKVADAKFKVDFHFINLTSNFLVHIHVYFSFSLNIFTIDLSTFCVGWIQKLRLRE